MIAMKYKIEYTEQFGKELKICRKRGYDLSLLRDVIGILEEEGQLPEEYSPHKLNGKYKGLWECHILEDWLLVWSQDNSTLTLVFTNTGTHIDLFG